ncbi:hypothetical protein SL621_22230, partial [Escherichia coli]|uniref:hypothetical protein n=1 Tax=Escherichia coli TaxID=562 RepID=UPI003862A1E8
MSATVISDNTCFAATRSCELAAATPASTSPERSSLALASVASIGQRNSYVKTWGCGGFLNETNIYS